ncbi:lytic transglycosylase domain-containing protein [Chelatococcus asaccharovorans]|uniref:lytic transglycosylase domain-containing protein n=1 Tax=Chelatococcus asaccharovorans TaxID=28210 RepID=UPI00224C712D|nr:lytic transglycosylase domain-containing protein [Chelatococcus asaccharovorans]CAH1671399.1 Soluble lytic murein transglycosylase precursor [Chelatococcus asaccharovorans]CAH1677180.1 Soluble lytic murein transglycosylase precursor [Chelatococcus asaccharovorans]
MKPRARLLAGIAVAVLSIAVVWPDRLPTRMTAPGHDIKVDLPSAALRLPLPPPAPATGIATEGPRRSAAEAIAEADPIGSQAAEEASAPTGTEGTTLAYASPNEMSSGDTKPPYAPPLHAPSVARPDLDAVTVEADAVTKIIDLYRNGDIAGGDALAAGLSGGAARTLVEWIAIRHNGSHLGYSRLSSFLAEHADWPQRDITQRHTERAMWRQKVSPATILSFFAGRQPESADGKFALALAYQQSATDKSGGQGDATLDKKAFALVQDAWRNDPVDRDLERAIRESFPAVLTAANNRARLERLAFRKDWTSAQRLAADIGPREVKLLKARMTIERGGNLKPALNGLSAAERADPLIQFVEAQELRRQGKRAEAAAIMLKAPTKPEAVVEGDQWAKERQRLARGLIEAGEPQTAYDIIKPNVAVSETDTIETEMLAGWIALRFLDKPDIAAKHFAAAEPHADLPISVARVTYWRGRAAEAAKDAAGANAFYEAAAQHVTTYYGQLARARLGKTDLPVSPPPKGDILARATLEKSDIVQAIRLLYHLDERRIAILLIDELARNVEGADAMTAVAHIAGSLGDTRAELVVGKRALYRGFPLDRTAFPTNGIPSFEAAGDSVERSMTYAIARQESAFAADAVSSAGARGLMQLMPATAKATAQRAGLPFDVDRLTNDPAYNATLGTAHLGELVGYWRGSYILTFAAYNAGPGNVRKWITAYGDPRDNGVDTVDWVERIPFPETRNYVQRVMENLQVYRHILGDRTALFIERDLRRGAFQ